MKQGLQGSGRKDNQYGPWLRAGGARNSPHEKQAGMVFNPQKSFWRLKNGEWTKQRGVEDKEQTVETQAVTGNGKSKATEPEVGELSKVGPGQAAQGGNTTESVLPRSDVCAELVRKTDQTVGNLYENREVRNMDHGPKFLKLAESLVQEQGPDTTNEGDDCLMVEEEQVTLVTQVGGSDNNKELIPAQASVNMETIEGPEVKEALIKQARRILRVLKSPKKHRHSSKELNSNTGKDKKSGKRKGIQGELDMDIDEEIMQEGKRNKVDLENKFLRSGAMEVGSNHTWTPMDK